jgi:hypothetical protein
MGALGKGVSLFEDLLGLNEESIDIYANITHLLSHSSLTRSNSLTRDVW